MAQKCLRSASANNCCLDRPTVEADGMCRLQAPIRRYPRANAAVALQDGPHHSPELTGALLPGVTDDRYEITCVENCRKGRNGHGATSSTTDSHPPCVATRATVSGQSREPRPLMATTGLAATSGILPARGCWRARLATPMDRRPCLPIDLASGDRHDFATSYGDRPMQ
jgi:hypothetical protein